MTDSFMHCCKKIKQLLCACLLALFATTAIASNSSLNIKSAELVASEEGYLLNADVDIKFNDDIEQAISKGFELNFLVEFQLVSPRKYWFDDEIVTVSHRVTLSYHALSRQYLVMRGDQQKTFSSLEEAKQELSEVRDWIVFKKADVEKGEIYNAALLMRLDHSKLPKALQVDAIGSDNWKMTSQRFEWSPSLFK
ncbi:MAG: DUF4390 domain-containing protein [Methylotenera sp.]